MIDILGRRAATVLRRLSSEGTWVALDFDGTLAPIVRDRARAAMSPRTSDTLRRLAERYPTVIVSGRARADVANRLAGAPVRLVFGNHGAEGGLRDASTRARFRREIRAAKNVLVSALEGVEGVEIEDKRYSLSVHDRKAEDPDAARAAIATAVAALGPSVRVEPGKRVTNVVHVDAPDKGTVVRALHESPGATQVVFVGDDVTDESVFRIRAPWLVSVRVGRSVRSDAPYFVSTRAHVDLLCEALVAARTPLGR